MTRTEAEAFVLASILWGPGAEVPNCYAGETKPIAEAIRALAGHKLALTPAAVYAWLKVRGHRAPAAKLAAIAGLVPAGCTIGDARAVLDATETAEQAKAEGDRSAVQAEWRRLWTPEAKKATGLAWFSAKGHLPTPLNTPPDAPTLDQPDPGAYRPSPEELLELARP